MTTEHSFEVGDIVSYTPDVSGPLYSLSSYYGSQIDVQASKTYAAVVKRVNTETVHLSFWMDGSLGGWGNRIPTTEALDGVDPAKARYSVPLTCIAPSGQKVRKIGDVPEGGLSPLDPRLQWLWEDADRVAKANNYCGQYRTLCDALGIPGPVKDFKIKRDFNGLEIGITVKARSKVEAEAEADKQLAERGLA